MQKVKVKGQLVQKTEWEHADGQMDWSDCISSRANAVGSNDVSSTVGSADLIKKTTYVKWPNIGSNFTNAVKVARVHSVHVN